MTIKSYAKVNIFLKIVGLRGSYHEINSRFMIVPNLYDLLEFKPKDCDDFTIEGDFSCPTTSNIIYKVYRLLKEEYPKVEIFFKTHKVVVEKNIPEFAGLGGGSSNGAAFLNLTNKVLNLNISHDKLADIGSQVGSDIPFFIYGYKSANVSGVGEIVKEFEEELVDIETFTPSNIKPSTKDVYARYRDSFLDNMDKELSSKLLKQTSHDILNKYQPNTLNDLLAPCLKLYPDLNSYIKEGSFLSGSGSTVFRRRDG